MFICRTICDSRKLSAAINKHFLQIKILSVAVISRLYIRSFSGGSSAETRHKNGVKRAMGEVKITFSRVPGIYKCAKIHNWGSLLFLMSVQPLSCEKFKNDIATSNKENSVIGFTCLKTGSATIESKQLNFFF